MKVVWTPRAQRRLRQIHDYIALDQPQNAVTWIERLLNRGEQIADQPRSGRVVPEYQLDTIREVFEGAYRIIYRVRAHQIDVLTIRHGAQPLPGQNRL